MSIKQSSSAKLTSATMPKSSPRSNKNFVKSGRKLSVTTTSAHLLQKKTDSPNKKKVEIPENASAEELDRMLDEDAIALLNIKKEIASSQQEELNKIKNKLLNVKKEYDTLHVANNFKSNELQSYKDREIQLSGVEEASYSTATTVQDQVENFNKQTEIVLEELAAEQRTLKMLTLMSKRLDKEIGQCRVDTAKTVTQLEHVKHDINIAENNMQNNKQELIEQEQKLEKLSLTIQSRKQERNQKINMLHNLSIDGEHSVQRLQTSLMESSKFVSRGRSSNNRTRGSTGRGVNTAGSRANRSRHGLTAGSVGEGMLDGMEGLDEFDDLIEGTSPLKRLTSNMIQDIVNRYKSQSIRMEKLKELDNELRINIITQQNKKKELTEHLSHTVFRIQQLASSRQIYQEVDLKDSALAATSKECEESKEKDFRLRLNIETLKLSIPRFLLKVTKEQQTIPTESQLPDAIVKLEDELTKLIKTIGSALLKDATPDDLALMTQQGSVPGSSSSSSDAQSEFSRLQRLPGFSRLQRQLFFNLMTAKPDVSKQNIRINQIGKVKKPKSTSGSTALVPEVLPTRVAGGGRPGSRGSPYKSPSPRVAQYGSALTLGTGRGVGSSSVVDGMDTTIGGTYGAADEDDDGADPALSRETIKNISRLIYERDHIKN